jgi:hypothetical protein
VPGQTGSASNGVLMNGDGYCLQAGPTLLVGFDGRRDGGTRWSLGSGVIPVQSAVSPRPQVTYQRITVHTVLPVAAPAAGAGAAGGAGLLLAGLLAGLLLVAGATLVFFGRRSRSRRHQAGRPVPDPVLRRAVAGDDGLYVVDVTAEVARRAAQGVVDGRPTEPLDVTSLL